MTTFTHKISTVFCLFAWMCFIIFASTPTFASSGAGRGTASATTSGGIQSSATGLINSTKGYADQATGLVSSANQATGALGGLAGSLGVGGDLLNTGTNFLGDAGNYLNQGKNALDFAGKLSDIDINSITSNFGSMGNLGLGSVGNLLGGSAKNILNNAETYMGKYFDSAKGINLDSIWGGVTNLQKDLTSNIKQLIAGDLSNFDMTTLSSALTSVGVPVNYVDLGPVGVATVVYEGQIPIALEAQYAANSDYSASLGPIGNMDFRNGQCMYDGVDYTGLLASYINGGAVKNEGPIGWLYLDTECWVTIGKGSVMYQYSSRRNWNGYKAYFDTMNYVDASGNPVDQATKDADLKKLFALEGSCRAKCATGARETTSTGSKVCQNKTPDHFKQFTEGRHITTEAMNEAIFGEFCKSHIAIIHRGFKQEAAAQGSNRMYGNLDMRHQQAVLDMGYQTGSGIFVNSSQSKHTPIGMAVRRALVQGNCSAAVNQFASSNLCKDYRNRCVWRLAMLRGGCAGGASVVPPATTK